jgi:protein tyrosine/serine phosphatase
MVSMTSKLGKVLSCYITLTLLITAAAAQSERYDGLPNFHRVNENLYRGAQPNGEGFKALAKLGIKTIINLRDNDQRALVEEKKAQSAGFQYFNVPITRFGRPDTAEVYKVLEIINKPEYQPVFVHCRYGADRTGVVIGAYRILFDGWTSKDAKAEANRHGMKIWQFQMKDFLSDLFRDKQNSGAKIEAYSP